LSLTYQKLINQTMHEIIKQFTDELAVAVATAIKSGEFQKTIADTKSANDAGTFKVIASTGVVDRQGEVIMQDGWELENYMQNPVILWAHDYSQLPIGVAEKVYFENGSLVVEGRFAPTDFAQICRRMYDEGFLRAVSVGLLSKKRNGNIITLAELLELSFVPVPANQQALSVRTAKELGLDVELLATKGFEFAEEQTPVESEPAVVTAEKGDVADALTAEEITDQKWEKLSGAYDIFDAFCAVYFDENTPVDQFAPLLKETADLLTQLADNPAMEMDSEKSLVAKQVKDKALPAFERNVKSGRVLSEKNRTLIKSTIDGLEATTAALRELHDATDTQGSEGKEIGDGPTPKPVEVGSDVKALDVFLSMHQILQRANTATSEVLATINKNKKKLTARQNH
jgi:hypothetical protein